MRRNTLILAFSLLCSSLVDGGSLQVNQRKRAAAPAKTPATSAARWEVQQSGVEDDLLDVCFVNAEVGWAVGKANTILRTRDGGKTWTRAVDRRERGGYEFTDVVFTSPTEGWIRATGTVLHTSDGGESWAPATKLNRSGLDYGFGPGSVVGSTRFQIHVPNTGVNVYRTDDGGGSWATVGELPRNAYGRIFFIDQQHGWVIADFQEKSIGFTTDGGKTWNFVNERVSNRSPQIKFVNPTNGWAFGEESTLLASVDGGHTWKRQYPGIPGYHPLRGMAFLNEHEGFIAAEDKVIHTTNGGGSWQTFGSFPPSTVYALSFPDNSHGWVVGKDGYISHYHLVTAGNRPR